MIGLVATEHIAEEWAIDPKDELLDHSRSGHGCAAAVGHKSPVIQDGEDVVIPRHDPEHPRDSACATHPSFPPQPRQDRVRRGFQLRVTKHDFSARRHVYLW